jgi:S1-C subfamily serine protease
MCEDRAENSGNSVNYYAVVPIVALLATGYAYNENVVKAPLEPLNPYQHTVLIERADGGHGSGVIVGSRTIYTVKHVVKGLPPHQIKVTTWDGQIVSPKSVFYSEREHPDFAELIFDDNTFATWAKISYEPLQPLEMLSGIGNPLTLRWAAFSAQVAMNHDKTDMGDYNGYTMISGVTLQGLSGGPLFNARNEVVGLYVAMLGVTLSPFHPTVPFGIGIILPSSKFPEEFYASK